MHLPGLHRKSFQFQQSGIYLRFNATKEFLTPCVLHLPRNFPIKLSIEPDLGKNTTCSA